MFLGYQDTLIALVADTVEELSASGLEFTRIEETNKNYTLYNGSYLTDEEIEQLEKKRIAELYMTRSDVERAIYKVKNMDFIDILKIIETEHKEVDLKALKIELGANNFYRGNPYIDQIGLILGFTSKQLDNFFETKDYRNLL